MPENPLLPLLSALVSSSILMLLVNYLAIQFGVNTWQQGIKLAAVLWVVDACLNIRQVQVSKLTGCALANLLSEVWIFYAI